MAAVLTQHGPTTQNGQAAADVSGAAAGVQTATAAEVTAREGLDTLQALIDSMTPGVVTRITRTAARAALLADDLLAAADEARETARLSPSGPGALMRLAADPDTRRGLVFLLALARTLGRQLAI